MENSTQANRFKKVIYLLFITLLISIRGFSQNVAINVSGAAPNASAGLDVDFPDKGLLIPRVALTGTANFAPLPGTPVAGMIVYNTATTGDVKPGFYYNDGSKWIAGFPVGNAIGDMLYWNGTTWNLLPVGTSGQYLTLNASNIPYWANGSTAVYASLTTNAATSITGTTAISGAVVISDGGSAILSRGVCYAITTSPTTSNSTVLANPATGTTPYSCTLTGLTPGTAYYVRAYSINNSTVSYGNEVTFTTLPVIPTLAATTAATVITANAAVSGGSVTSTGGAPILERGICYGTTSNPTTANSTVVDPAPGIGSFVSILTGLNAGTTYYVRSYARNSAGTNYGAQISFITRPLITSTTSATAITSNTAATGGVIAPFGTANVIWNYGVAYSLTSNAATPTLVQTGTYPPIAGLTYVTNLIGLTSNTLYYIRAYATGSGFTIYGPELSFTTTAPVSPSVTTTAASAITPNSALSGGNVTNDGGSTILERGICWATSTNPTTANNVLIVAGTTGSFSGNITGLTGNTPYFVRAYARNSVGTSYGNEITFTTCGTPLYSIGQSLAGGTVYYVDCSGQHGLIVANVDQGVDVAWGCSGTLVGASGSAIYTGLANTNAILAGCSTAGIAARLCANYTAGGINIAGFTNWYLPSINELQLMKASGLVNPPSSLYTYWSSTEGGATLAAGWYFNGNYQLGSTKGNTTQMVVRAVRAF
jgi:hypothetical protein